MAEKITTWDTGYLVLSLMFGVVGISLLYFAYVLYKDKVRFLKKAKVTEGTVIYSKYHAFIRFGGKITDKAGKELESINRTEIDFGRSTAFFDYLFNKVAVVNFITDDGVPVNHADYYFWRYKEGDKVKVLYDFAAPSKESNLTEVVINPNWMRLWGEWFFVYICFGGVALYIAVGSLVLI